MAMELRRLRCFFAALEELNFARVTEHPHIEQSPLSRAIMGQEEKLGAMLFAHRQAAP
jgi:DNA-binding transcriptional LysR family regulator